MRMVALAAVGRASTPVTGAPPAGGSATHGAPGADAEWRRIKNRHLCFQNRNDRLDFFLSVARLRLGFVPSKG